MGKAAGPACGDTHAIPPTHRQRPGVSTSAPTGGRENSREGPGVQETFQPFLSWSDCLREGLGLSYCLCLRGTWGLRQSSFDGGHQLQKLALHVHVAIASLLGVNQLSCYEHFKEAGDLGSPLAADVQTARELIYLFPELKILGLVASSATMNHWDDYRHRSGPLHPGRAGRALLSFLEDITHFFQLSSPLTLVPTMT